VDKERESLFRWIVRGFAFQRLEEFLHNGETLCMIYSARRTMT
jgi:hypothetical protein